MTSDDILKAFNHPKLKVYTEKQKVEEYLLNKDWKNSNLLLMVSDSEEGLNGNTLAKKISPKLN